MGQKTDKNTGFGSFHPLDAREYAEVTIFAENGITTHAESESNDDTVLKCADALCRLIVGFPVADILQMNNNAVYYNIDETLPLDRLFCATTAVNAVKKAAVDYMNKNSIPVPEEYICKCLTGEQTDKTQTAE